MPFSLPSFVHINPYFFSSESLKGVVIQYITVPPFDNFSFTSVSFSEVYGSEYIVLYPIFNG